MSESDAVTDPRISEYRQFLDRIEREHLGDSDAPVGPELHHAEIDEIDDLGRSILSVTSRLASRYEQERQLIELSEEIVQGVYRDEVLDHIFESFRDVIPYDRIGCALLENQDQTVRSRWARADYPVIRIRAGFAAKIDQSSLQTIIETGQPRIINDTVAYLKAHPNSTATKLIVAEGIRSSLTCPLIAMGRPIGFLFFSSREPFCYETIHQETFTRVASMVSIAVEKAILYEELSQLNRELIQARTLLEHQATHDSLTGLLNHEAIFKQLDALVSRRDRTVEADRKSLGVMMLDIDYFKKVNDTYGHLVGDDVLKSVADTLSTHAQPPAFVGRYGGEEFLIVTESSGRPAEPVELAEQIRHGIENLVITGDRGSVSVTVSIGVATASPAEIETATRLIQRADNALYAAKSGGRNRCVIG